MVRGDEMLAMGDCAINISYEDTVDKDGNVTLSAADKLAETGVECARVAKIFGIEPKVAFLSYSTKGSGKGRPSTSRARPAPRPRRWPPSSTSTARCSSTPPCPPPSAAQVPGQQGCRLCQHLHLPGDPVRHIGYKIAQRLGGFDAYGPILTGLNAPSTTSPAAATPRRSIRCPSSPPHSPEKREAKLRKTAPGFTRGGFLIRIAVLCVAAHPRGGEDRELRPAGRLRARALVEPHALAAACVHAGGVYELTGFEFERIYRPPKALSSAWDVNSAALRPAPRGRRRGPRRGR